MILSLILVFLLFGIYGWLSGIQCGVSLVRLLPASTLTRHSLRLFSPWWELANIFLLFGAAAFTIFFKSGLPQVMLEVLPLLTVGAIAIVLRAGLTMLLKQRKARTGLRWWNLLLAAICFVVPLSFGSAGVRLLIGYNFWDAPSGWALVASLAAGLLALAMSYVYYSVGQTPHGRIQALSRILNTLFCVMVALFLQQIILTRQPHLLATPFAGFVLLISFMVLWQAVLWYSARDRYMWWYLSLVGVGSPVLLALANHPYLMFPGVSVADAYASDSLHWLAVVSLYVVLPVVLVAFMALAWRLMNPRHR